MSSRVQHVASLMSSDTHTSNHLVPHPESQRPSPQAWIDPANLPSHHHLSSIAGNVPDYVKKLNYNTYMSYGVGEADSFGYKVGKAVKFIEVNMNRRKDHNKRLEATTVAEIEVTKQMLNGAGMLHGGCVGYLVDNCCSTPLVVLGLVTGINGVGVTQSMSVHFHAPATRGTVLRIVSTSISLGGRVMSCRCEIMDKGSGRIIASAFMSKMQPLSKL